MIGRMANEFWPIPAPPSALQLLLHTLLIYSSVPPFNVGYSIDIFNTLISATHIWMDIFNILISEWLQPWIWLFIWLFCFSTWKLRGVFSTYWFKVIFHHWDVNIEKICLSIVSGFCLTHHYLEVVAGDDFLSILHPADSWRWASCHSTLQLNVGGLVGICVGRVIQELRRHCRNTQNNTTHKQ